MGVWLPLALAQIYQALVFIASAFAKPESGMKVPTVSEALRSFALPAMAEAMKTEDDAAKANNMVESLKAMAARTGGKVEIVKAEK